MSAEYEWTEHDWRESVSYYHKEGDERTKRKIAKKLKGLNMFSVEFIASITELDVKTVNRLKAV